MTNEELNLVRTEENKVVEAYRTLTAAAGWFRANGSLTGAAPYVNGNDVACYLEEAASKVQDAVNAIGWLTDVE